MRRGAMGIATDVGGLAVAVMASAPRLIIRGRRFRSVLMIVARVQIHVRGRNEVSGAAGVHRRFGHRHHARLQRRHDEKHERERGTKPRNPR